MLIRRLTGLPDRHQNVQQDTRHQQLLLAARADPSDIASAIIIDGRRVAAGGLAADEAIGKLK